MWQAPPNIIPLALAALLTLAIPAAAQTPGPVKLALLAQPLGPALNELARQANLQLLFSPELVAGKRAPALHGALHVRAALECLLAGSGLQAAIDGNNVIIKPAPAGSDKPAACPED